MGTQLNEIHADVVRQLFIRREKTAESISFRARKINPVKRHISQLQTRVIRITSNNIYSITHMDTHTQTYSHIFVRAIMNFINRHNS